MEQRMVTTRANIVVVLMGSVLAGSAGGCVLDRTPQAPDGADEGTVEPPIGDPGQDSTNTSAVMSPPSGAPLPNAPNMSMVGGLATPQGGGGPEAAPPCECGQPDCERTDCPRPDGEPCEKNRDCESAYCNNGRCCAEGQCCVLDADCGGGEVAICESNSRCEGSRGQPTCVDFHCTIPEGGQDDDSGCDPMVEASDCGPYLSVFCNGMPDQSIPSCPEGCQGDDECDPSAHCAEGVCQPDGDNGSPCDRNGQCLSDHCGGGICCNEGDCCQTPEDCPATYAMPPACDTPSACQGSRRQPACDDFTCTSGLVIEDDSACTNQTLSQMCDGKADVYCNGEPTQEERPCDPACNGHRECDNSHHCNPVRGCIPDLDDGEPCVSNQACKSGHCNNGYCCGRGTCCAADWNCLLLTEVPVCSNAKSCQGHWRVGACNDNHQCVKEQVDNDSGCSGRMAKRCAPYAPATLTCSSSPVQFEPRCRTTCTTANHCAGNNICRRDGTCGRCRNHNDCAGGNVCKNDGTCAPGCRNDGDCPPGAECNNNGGCVCPQPSCQGRCGLVSNECNRTRSCGCPDGQMCNSATGMCVQCPQPTCNGRCGQVTNDCGRTRNCTCDDGETCNMTTGRCECRLPMCPAGAECGSVSNDCGTVNCGSCDPGEKCNMTSRKCECPDPVCPIGAECGSVSNDCGTVICGDCDGPGEKCNMTSRKCECPLPMCNGRCGEVSNDCGTVPCPPCESTP